MNAQSPDLPMNMDMVIYLLRPQLEVTIEDIEPIIYIGLYHHRDLIGSPNIFIINQQLSLAIAEAIRFKKNK